MTSDFGEKFENARKRFNAFGPLGVTGEDHRSIGSTPPEILQKNPGKTKLELMSDRDISIWLRNKKEELEKYSSEKLSANSFVRSYLPTLREEIKATLVLLRANKRLPEGYQDWKIE